MDVTSHLAAFAARISYDMLPKDVREQSRMFLLDAVGIGLGAVDFF